MGCRRVSARKQAGRGKAGLAVGRAIGAVVLLRKKPPAEPGGSGVARRFKIPNIGDDRHPPHPFACGSRFGTA